MSALRSNARNGTSLVAKAKSSLAARQAAAAAAAVSPVRSSNGEVHMIVRRLRNPPANIADVKSERDRAVIVEALFNMNSIVKRTTKLTNHLEIVDSYYKVYCEGFKERITLDDMLTILEINRTKGWRVVRSIYCEMDTQRLVVEVNMVSARQFQAPLEPHWLAAAPRAPSSASSSIPIPPTPPPAPSRFFGSGGTSNVTSGMAVESTPAKKRKVEHVQYDEEEAVDDAELTELDYEEYAAYGTTYHAIGVTSTLATGRTEISMESEELYANNDGLEEEDDDEGTEIDDADVPSAMYTSHHTPRPRAPMTPAMSVARRAISNQTSNAKSRATETPRRRAAAAAATKNPSDYF